MPHASTAILAALMLLTGSMSATAFRPPENPEPQMPDLQRQWLSAEAATDPLQAIAAWEALLEILPVDALEPGVTRKNAEQILFTHYLKATHADKARSLIAEWPVHERAWSLLLLAKTLATTDIAAAEGALSEAAALIPQVESAQQRNHLAHGLVMTALHKEKDHPLFGQFGVALAEHWQPFIDSSHKSAKKSGTSYRTTDASTDSIKPQAMLFDIATRREALQQPAYAEAKQACLAADISLDAPAEPIAGLREKKGYGGHHRSQPFAWQVMVLGGRALAGDDASVTALTALLSRWAQANALTQSDESLDSYYELKRTLLPVIVNYAIIADSLPAEKRQQIENWIDRLVRPLDEHFGGADVDRNNHRQMADATLMAWGTYRGDKTLYSIGLNGFAQALEEARADGSLPLETRRGARALWYMRHVLSSLAVIAAIADTQNNDLYATTAKSGVSLDTILHSFLNMHHAPISVLPDAAENLKPGPSTDYLSPDRGYLHRRNHGRHYMAFAEILSRRDSFAAQRLRQLMQASGFAERPLIDEYAGGNTTCFFMEPSQQP